MLIIPLLVFEFFLLMNMFALALIFDMISSLMGTLQLVFREVAFIKLHLEQNGFVSEFLLVML